MTNLWTKIKHWWKQLLFGTGVVGIALAASVGGPGDIPCRADTTRPAHERMSECPIPAHERASFKGQEIAGKAQLGTHQRSNYDIEIVEVNAIEKGVEVFARAWKDGKQIGFGKDGTVDIERFVKQTSGNGKNGHLTHIVVPDEAGDISVDEKEKDLDTGELRTVTRHYREDPEENLLVWLEHTISVVAKHSDENIVEGKRGNTTTTVNPDADPESTSVDGFVNNIGTDSWSVIRDAVTGTSNGDDDDGTGTISPNSFNSSGTGNTEISRAFFLFDTSSIGTDTVDSATLSIFFDQIHDGDNDAQAYINVYTSSPNSNTELVNNDYDQLGTTKQSDGDKDITNISTSAYTDFALNATGISNVDTNGISKFSAREGHDAEDVPIASDSRSGARARFVETADSNEHPKLVVEHSAAAEPEPPQSQFSF